MMVSRIWAFIFIVVAAFSVQSVDCLGMAEDWEGNVDTDWDNDANFSADPNGVDIVVDPGNYGGISASIDLTSAMDVGQQCNALTIQGGAVVVFDQDWNNLTDKDVVIDGVGSQLTISAGTVSFGKKVTVSGGGALIITGGIVSTEQDLIIEEAGSSFTMSGGTLNIGTDGGKPFTVHEEATVTITGGTINALEDFMVDVGGVIVVSEAVGAVDFNVTGDMTIKKDQGGTTSSYSMSAGDMDVGGDLNLDGNGNGLTIAVTVSGGTMDIAGDLITNKSAGDIAQLNVSGTGVFTLVGDAVHSGSAAAKEIWDFNFTGGTVNFGGDVDMLNTANSDRIDQSGGNVINFTGTKTWDNYGTFLSTSGTVNFDGNTTIEDNDGGGSFTFYDLNIVAGDQFNQGNGVADAPINIDVTHDWTIGAASVFTDNQNKVTLTGTSDQDITMNGESFYDLTISNTGIAGSDDILLLDALDVNNDLAITGGDLNANGQNITVFRHWNNSGGTFTHGSANSVTFDGSTADQNITSNASPFYNLIFNNTSIAGSDDLLLLDALDADNDLTISDGDLNANGFDITVGGDWLNTAGTFTHANANSVTFDGGGEQTITSLAQSYYNVVFANTSATVGTDITLLGNMQIDNTLTMTDGYVDLGGLVLTIGTAAGTPGSLAYTADWMYGGTLTRWKATATIAIGAAEGHFPMGDPNNGTGVYRPFWFANTAVFTVGGTVSLVHTPKNPTWYILVDYLDASWAGGTVLQAVSDSYWTVSTANGLAGGTINLRYGGTGFGQITALTDLNATLLTGTVGTFSATGGSVADPRVNRTGLSLAEFDGGGTQDFRIGTKDRGVSPLPVNLLNFDVLPVGNIVVLNWSTASESNNEKFLIERSSDGQQFEIIDEILGGGNSTEIIGYSASDPFPFSGISYYRLTQVDYDGVERLFPPAMIVFNEITEPQIVLYPNPNDGNHLNVALSGFRDEVLVVVYDHLGKNYFSKVEIVANHDKHVFGIDLSERLPAGIYFITATSDHQIFEKTLIVR